MKISRNALCPCGSGKKYKKCCLNKTRQPSLLPVFNNQDRLEPHLHLVKSVIWKGYRWRALWSRLYPCPIKQSFHEFIIGIVKSTVGNDWIKSQWSHSGISDHAVIHWLKSYEEWKRVNKKEAQEIAEDTWGAAPTGDVMALHALAYDFYCLQVVNKLPDFLVNRLRNQNEFQGARYEVAAASIIARAGFDITFLDDKVKSIKHCEFIAKNKYSQVEIGVEAKSRRRKGVLHEDGDIDYSAIIKGDVERLFRKACAQKPEGFPYLIFIDLNARPTPEIPFSKKPWISDMKLMLDKRGTPSKSNPDLFNAIAVTNFAYYYAGNTNIAPPGEFLFIMTKYPKDSCEDNMSIKEIYESLQRYSHIPEEV